MTRRFASSRKAHVILSVALSAAFAVAIPFAANRGQAQAARSAAQPVTLTVWDQATGTAVAAYKVVDSTYMKLHPGVKINHQFFPYQLFNTKFRTAIAARSGPDIAAAFPGAAGASLFKQGMLPLDSYIAQLPAAERKQIRLLNISAAPDGRVYAVPLGEYAYVFWYNKNLFKKAGLDPANPPATYSQLLTACAKLKAIGTTPIAAGWKDGGTLEWYFYILGQELLSKADFAKWQRLHLPLTSSVFQTLFKAVLDMQSKGCFDKNAIGLDTFTDAPAAFNSGKAAMLLYYLPPSASDVMKEFGDPNVVDVFAPPRLPQAAWPGPSTDAGPSNGMAITTWSQHPDAAWQYLRYLMGPQAQQVQWQMAQNFPNNSGAHVVAPTPASRHFLQILSYPNDHTLYLSLPTSVLPVLYKQAPALMEGTISVNDFLTQIEVPRSAAVQFWQH